MWKYIFLTEMQPAFYFMKYNHIYSHSLKSNSEFSGNLICLQKDSEHLKNMYRPDLSKVNVSSQSNNKKREKLCVLGMSKFRSAKQSTAA